MEAGRNSNRTTADIRRDLEAEREQLATAAETLRRLPGTGGRATVAAVPCPHCAEPNAVSAVLCARCGLPMVLPEAAPIPEPVYAPPLMRRG